MREKHTAIYTETCWMKVTQETQRDTVWIFYWQCKLNQSNKIKNCWKSNSKTNLNSTTLTQFWLLKFKERIANRKSPKP